MKIFKFYGLSDDRWEVVESGLASGARVIVGPGKTLRRLREGDSVTERKQDPAKAVGADDDGKDDAE